MTTFKGPQNTAPRQTSSESGNAWQEDNKVAIGASLTTNDEVIVLDVPAGVRLHGLKYRAGDLDTGAVLAVNLGYRSVHAEQKLAAAPTYFLAASTAFQAAQNGWVDIPFEPITFNEPVQIVLKPTVSAAGLPGATSIWAIGEGRILGVA
ncbi:MAG TPA: hypothetical protein VGF12_07020 [Roseateles sp.]|uniref:hypothetical protein n=1 Tax=Roseateles sp. TaxID=1971397 RepID=UPI002EDAAE39